MELRIEVLGAAHLELVDDVALLEPRAQVFEAMLDGWRSQQLSRNLTFATIDAGARVVSRFRHDTEVWPWEWTPGQLEGWCAELREHKLRAPSTVRSYQLAVRSFLAYVTDPLYGWDRECAQRFGTRAVQPIQARNLAERLAQHGVTRLGRLGALKQLVCDVPAPVLGELIGYSPRDCCQTRHGPGHRLEQLRRAQSSRRANLTAATCGGG